MTFRIMPNCDNQQQFEEGEDCTKYICKGHHLSTHGDPYRDNKFWVYPASMRPFNLGKGDYRVQNIE